ncbi:MAG: helix-turn-helix domain-containing protein [Verrucomicrobia bacterium]|nr:helix-turn-helix domain-containing protein [Verrucomicrobiota bacterium]MCH8512355.1 helix-turn-helix domain-containing protein [Kiritimatiellia bacterium]
MKQTHSPKIHHKPGTFCVFRVGQRIGESVAAGALAAAAERESPWMVHSVSDTLLHHADDPDLLGAISVSWHRKTLERMRTGPFPAINCSNSNGPVSGMGNFLSDDYEVGRLAARHLIAKGFREFMVISYTNGITNQERREGFEEEIRKHGYPVQVFLSDFQLPQHVASTRHEYVKAMSAIFHEPFQSLPLGSGVFATSDAVATYFLRVMAMAYPEHMDTTGVLGVDNELGRHTHLGVLPALSSIEPGFFAMGHAAMSWLLENPGPAGREKVESLLRRFPPKEVVERASTACGGCADPMTARMIRWAWNRIHRGDPVTITDMAAVHRMSLKTLERRFSEHAGATAEDTVRRLRLDLARSLLRETRLPVAEISEHCGYAKQDVLSRALRAAEGCSPREFRKRHSAPSDHQKV